MSLEAFWVFSFGFALAVAAISIWDAMTANPPGDATPAVSKAKSHSSEVSRLLSGTRLTFAGLALFSGLSNILMLTGSFFMLEIYDRVLPSRSLPTLVVLSVLAAGLFAAQGAIDVIRARVLARIGRLADERLAPRVFDVMTRLPLKATNRGDGQQAVRDLDTVRMFLSGMGPTTLFDLPWMPLYLAIIYAFHPLLGHAALAGAVMLIILTLLTESLTKAPSLAASQASGLRTRLGEGCVRNAEVLTAMGLGTRMGQRWQATAGAFIASQQRVADVTSGIGTVSRVMRMILQSGILALGAYLVIRGEATAGVIIASSILTSRALAPIELAISHWKGFVAARQSWERLDKVLKLIPETRQPLALPAPEARLEAEAVTIAPPGEARILVADVSFALKAGQGLGIIGPSGSGKSSLVRALVGVWTPARGRVRLDGAALDQWTSEQLGRHVGYLPQDVELFAGTVAQNIARFEAEARSEEIIAAARAAGVHDVIVGFKDGYETDVGENGASLSAGQRQRIALARALYGNPFLVVLDEPNSNLDLDGEAALTGAIQSVRDRGGIVIVVAHRPSALAALDVVLTMAQGRAVAFGPRDEVLSKVLDPGSAPTLPRRGVTEIRRAGT